MFKRILTAFLLLFFYAFALSVYWLKIGFANIPLRETLYLASSGIATIAGIFALLTYGFKGPRTLTLLLLTVGIGYWFIGDVLFDYYQYILKIDPFPSIADIFYTLAYPFLLVGLLNEVKASHVHWRKLNSAIPFLFMIAALSLGAIVVYFGIFQAYDAKESLFNNIIAMGYGGGDLLLILVNMLVLVLAWEFRGGNFSRVWVTVFISFIIILIADILFAIYTNQYNNGMWFYKRMLDSLWMAGYLIFGYALFDIGFSIQEAYVKIGKLVKKEEKKEKKKTFHRIT